MKAALAILVAVLAQVITQTCVDAQLATLDQDLDRLCELQGRHKATNDTSFPCGSCFDNFQSADGKTGPGRGACRLVYGANTRFILTNDNPLKDYVTTFETILNGAFIRIRDVDNDGLLDVITTGSTLDKKVGLLYYHNIGTDTAPEFELITQESTGALKSLYPFDGVGKADAGLEGEGKVNVFFDMADLDGDGDPDMLFGARRNIRGTPIQRPYLWINNGGSFTEVETSSSMDPFRNFDNAYMFENLFDNIYLEDIDNDGDYDVVCIISGTTVSIYTNIGNSTNPLFDPDNVTFLDNSIGKVSSLGLMDVNNDGLLDIVAISTPRNTFLFQNTGTLFAPKFELAGDSVNPLSDFPKLESGSCDGYFLDGACSRSFTFADLHNKNSMDLYLGREDSLIERWRSTTENKNKFVDVTTKGEISASPLDHIADYITISANTYITLSFADVDGDGDLDAFVGDYKDYTIHYFRNDGPATLFTHFGSSSLENPFYQMTFQGIPHVNILPQQSSGDPLQAVVITRTSYYGEPSSPAVWFEQNSETGTWDKLNTFKIKVNEGIALTFGDLDGNGMKAYSVKWESGAIISFDIDYTKHTLTQSSNNLFGEDTEIAFSLHGGSPYIALFDYDSDGDLDLLLGSATNFIRVIVNEGNSSAPSFDVSKVEDIADVFENYASDQSRLSETQPIVADTDGDGDLDLWVSHASGAPILFENTAADCATSCSGARGTCGEEGYATSSQILSSGIFETARANFELSSPSFAAGVCSCTGNYSGAMCEQCDSSHYGPSCEFACPANSLRSSEAGTFIYPEYPTVDDCVCLGNFQSDPDLTVLSCVCPPGYEYESATCQRCKVNFYSNSYSLDSCEACPGGMVTTDVGAKACTCSPGYELVDGECKACEIGYFKSGYGTEMCNLCPEGEATFSEGATQCSTCSDTQYGENCEFTCPEHSARDLSAEATNNFTFPTADECQCTGNFVADPSSSSLSCGCYPGYGFDGTTCQACRKNTFKGDYGLSSCGSCTGGMVTEDVESTECTCEPGFELVDNQCSPCALGSYKSSYGVEACIPCENSTATYETGSTECIALSNCEAGYEQLTSENCTLCENGFYNNGSSVACIQCPVSRPVTLKEGSTSLSECLASSGTFYNPSTSEAISCEDDMFPANSLNCTTTGLEIDTLPLVKGFWRITLNTLDVQECADALYCNPSKVSQKASQHSRLLSGFNTSDADVYCTDFHTGILCSECINNYGIRSSGVCEECTEEAAHTDELLTIAWIIVIGVVGLIPACIVAYSGAKKAKTVEKEKQENESSWFCGALDELMNTCGSSMTYFIKVSVKIRLSLVFLQIYNQFITTTSILETDGAALSTVSSLDMGSFLHLFNIGCSPLQVNFYTKLLAATLWPLGVLLSMVITTQLFRWRGHYDKALGWAIWISLELLFVVYPSVSSNIIRTFLYQSFDRHVGDETPYEALAADPTIDVSTFESHAYRVYAGIMIVVYPIGIAVIFWGLWYKHKQLGEVWTKASSFLWEPYKPNLGFYESVELLRRFLLTSGFVLVTQAHAEIAVIAFTACVVFFVLLVQGAKPYVTLPGESIFLSNQVFAQVMLLLLLLLGFAGLLQSYVVTNADALRDAVIAIGCIAAIYACATILIELYLFWRVRSTGDAAKGDAKIEQPSIDPNDGDQFNYANTPMATTVSIEQQSTTLHNLPTSATSIVIEGGETMEETHASDIQVATVVPEVPNNTPEGSVAPISRVSQRSLASDNRGSRRDSIRDVLNLSVV